MSQLASCSRTLSPAFSRQWNSRSASAVLAGPRILPHSLLRHHARRSYTTRRPDLTLSSADGAGASRLAGHLNTVFSPLTFPPELAARILTHSSHRDAAVSNNTRLSFIGRRVLNSYLMLFLHSAPSISSEHDYELIAERTLNTYVLGEHIAPKWELGRVLKWSPVKAHPEVEGVAGDYSKLSPKVTRTVGLYKVQGSAVEAVVGGIYHQFGGDTAHRVFHTRVLPNILLPGLPAGLNDVFHDHAQEICKRMGGSQGSLVTQKDASSKPRPASTQHTGAVQIP